MSHLDPMVSAQRRPTAHPYANLAALAKGLPLQPPPPIANLQMQPAGAAAVNLSIALCPAGGVALDITRSAAKKEKPAKSPKAAAPVSASRQAAAPPAKKPHIGGITVARVPASEPPPLDAAEIASCQVAQVVSPIQERVMADAAKRGISSAHIWRVRSDYYDQELAWRRDVLGAASTLQLCKSMIMENTKVSDMTLEQATAAGRVKYICVMLQYGGTKLQKEKLTDVVRRMEGATPSAAARCGRSRTLRNAPPCLAWTIYGAEVGALSDDCPYAGSKAVGKKQYSLRMVSQEVSDQLSGYTHNAVTPFGMAQEVPLLLSDKIKALPEGKLWLGGGEPDLKMRVDVAELAAKWESAGRPAEFADVIE